jgi:hypothetical protein
MGCRFCKNLGKLWGWHSWGDRSPMVFPGEKTPAIAGMMHADRRRSAFCSGREPRRSLSYDSGCAYRRISVHKGSSGDFGVSQVGLNRLGNRRSSIHHPSQGRRSSISWYWHATTVSVSASHPWQNRFKTFMFSRTIGSLMAGLGVNFPFCYIYLRD